MYRKICLAELKRDVLYKDSDFEIDSDNAADLKQFELPYQSTTNKPTTDGSVVGPQLHSTKKQEQGSAWWTYLI